MTDNTQPEALRLAEQYDHGDPAAHGNAWKAAVCTELRRQHDRIAELEAELEAVGAGGVSGPMMGQPQAMPDLSALTERGAKAWAGVDAQALREGGASPSANAGEPFGWVKQSEIDSSKQFGGSINLWRRRYDCDVPVYLAAPPTAQAEGWTKASKQLPPCREDQLYIGINTAGFAGVFNAVRVVNGNTYCLMEVAEESVSIMSDLAIWMPLPAPPTSAEGVEHG